jgi:hypothetical protein
MIPLFHISELASNHAPRVYDLIPRVPETETLRWFLVNQLLQTMEDEAGRYVVFTLFCRHLNQQLKGKPCPYTKLP